MRVRLMELFCMPDDCIYALVSDVNKRFMVGYSKHLFTALGRIRLNLETPRFRCLKNDIENVEVVVLESNIENDRDKKIKVNHHVQNYLKLGYEEYIPSNAIKYKVKTDIYSYRHHSYFSVYLEDSRRTKIIVGLFRSQKDMLSFLDKYYPDNEVKYGIQYADNQYTNTFYGIKKSS